MRPSALSLLIAYLAFLGGCGDPPLYQTPLPYGYAQWSNGGEFGHIVKQESATSGRPVAPLGKGPSGREQWCNDFGWHGQWVVGEVIEYADRAFVHPPLSKRYLILDTANEQVTYYGSRTEALAAWGKLTNAPFPQLTREHASRTRLLP